MFWQNSCKRFRTFSSNFVEILPATHYVLYNDDNYSHRERKWQCQESFKVDALNFDIGSILNVLLGFRKNHLEGIIGNFEVTSRAAIEPL